MDTLIISDIHGDFQALEELLRTVGVISSKGTRRTDKASRVRTISIGDLANCVQESKDGDIKCLQRVGDWIDFLIMGNHEIPYFDKDNSFSGFFWYQEVNHLLAKLENEKKIIPCYLAGDFLISHAGWDKSMHPYISTAEEARNALFDTVLNHGWNHRYFSDVSWARGGRNSHGGILWEDFKDLRSPFPQIVGHTQDARKIRSKENAICIDTGGGKVGGIPTAWLIR